MNDEEKTKEIYNITYNQCIEDGYSEKISRACAIMSKTGAEIIAQWKDGQIKQLLIEKTKLLSPSAAQDSVKRCTIEEVYRELFNEELPNSNPYIK